MAKCKYKYKTPFLKNFLVKIINKQCPYDAEPGSDFCKWHIKKDGKDFSGRKIKEKYLGEAYFVKAKLFSVDFHEANLWGANFYQADLSHANLRGANLWKANLQEVNFKNADLENADLENVNLKIADLKNANLKKANFSNTQLVKAGLIHTDFKGTDLHGANFQGSNLSDASLQGANLYNSDLTNTLLNDQTDLRGAILYAAEIKNTKKLQYAKISGKNPGEMCIEELLADNIHNLFNSKETDFGKALIGVIKPNLKLLGIEKDKQFVICKDVYIYRKKPLEIIFNKRLISRYKENEIRLKLYEMAKDVYINLKNYFKNAGLYDESGNFFIGEYRVRGKISEISAKQYCYVLKNRIKNSFRKFVLRKHEENTTHMPKTRICKLIGSIISNYFAFLINKILFAISSYGESVWRIILTAPSVIGFYAAIYWLSKGITYGTHSAPIHDFLTSLYFSIVTFTTLGYGDLHPIARTWVRLIAGSEAFLGAFLLAYFVVIVSRKIMR